MARPSFIVIISSFWVEAAGGGSVFADPADAPAVAKSSCFFMVLISFLVGARIESRSPCPRSIAKSLSELWGKAGPAGPGAAGASPAEAGPPWPTP